MALQVCVRADFIRRTVRLVLPELLYRVAAELLDAFWGTLRLGYHKYCAIRALYPDQCRYESRAVSISLPQLRHAVWIRPGTTDASELVHSVIREAYRSFLPDRPVRTIVDAGANIGDTTVWYLNRFSGATVVALEPDADNYALLVRNCQPYGRRAIALNAALWPTRRQLALCRSGKASEHSVSASPGAAADSTIDGLPIPALMNLIGSTQGGMGIKEIDILKCDIEGAELNVFEENSDEWLPNVRSIVIEIHGARAHEVVMRATGRHGFQHRVYRDTHVFWR